MTKTSYHVYSRANGKWSVKRSGASRASESYPTKSEAIRGARKLVVSSGGGDLIVHDRDGRVISRADIVPPVNSSSNGNQK